MHSRINTLMKERGMNRRELLALIPISLAGYVHAATESGCPGMCRENVPPVGAEPLSARYIGKVCDMLRWIRGTQSENLLEAAHVIARTYRNGSVCWAQWDMGHSTTMDVFPGRDGEPEIFTQGYDRTRWKQGDLLLVNICGDLPIEEADQKGLFIIGGPAPWGGDAKGSEDLIDSIGKVKVRPYADLWIETNITTLGAVMNVPGMPAPFGPVSGALGMVTYWMMLADACRVLAREGLSAPVKGDTPELMDQNIPWACLDAPLMDDYFDEVIRQIGLIGAELGALREMARTAVDSVLAGGKVFVYSRYAMGLSAEASYRRGGMLLTRGLYDEKGEIGAHFGVSDFTGTKNDTVIMGLAKPDDEVDLRHFDTFRKRGMKIAAIGPSTRNLAVPEGRTIPKEADLYSGNMCDTTGMFAVKGFPRKICPTSGVLLNQMFWAFSMEVASEIIRRTGDVPAILFSGALKWGMEHNRRMEQLYARRGY